jgi:tRNA(adenine34) deaminase
MSHLPDLAARQQDLTFMQLALQLAAEAAAAGEVPVGAVVVRNGSVVGTGRNSPIQTHDPSAHAEMVALRAAACAVGNYRLEDCTLYVTLEPCAMCCGGILHSRLKRVVFGAADPKTGCAGSVLDLFAQPQLNHQTQVEGGLLAEQAGGLLQDFFRQKRAIRRERAVHLREDALRTPDRCFDHLPGYPWASRFISDLPGLAGLRLHFVDEGPRDNTNTYLCLHPVPGWSYSYRACIAERVGQGMRVLAPDLLGFGKSDKPKREDAHSLEFHSQYLIEWLERLDLKNITLVVPHAHDPLVDGFMAQASNRIQSLLVQPIDAVMEVKDEVRALQAPYPDAGHRAAERAFLSLPMRTKRK